MRIAISCDHTGLALKLYLIEQLQRAGHAVQDLGTHSEASMDYPDIAVPLAKTVVRGKADLGVVICSNGVGVSVAANKVVGARAALCSEPWSSRRAREHTNCNVLALGAYAVGREVAWETLSAFLEAEFQGGRHSPRVAKLDALDACRYGEDSGE